MRKPRGLDGCALFWPPGPNTLGYGNDAYSLVHGMKEHVLG